jgi:hypothetical protein
MVIDEYITCIIKRKPALLTGGAGLTGLTPSLTDLDDLHFEGTTWGFHIHFFPGMMIQNGFPDR